MPTARAEMLIRAPIAEVFEAFANPDITTKIWFTKSSGRLETGQTVRWDWEMYGASAHVVVKAVVPNQRIEFAWGEPGALTDVTWTFTPHGERATFVSIVNTGFNGDANAILHQVADSTEGFTIVLAALKALLEHGVILTLVRDRHPGLLRN